MSITTTHHTPSADQADESPEVSDLVYQRIMSRWGLSEKAARDMVEIEKRGCESR